MEKLKSVWEWICFLGDARRIEAYVFQSFIVKHTLGNGIRLGEAYTIVADVAIEMVLILEGLALLRS